VRLEICPRPHLGVNRHSNTSPATPSRDHGRRRPEADHRVTSSHVRDRFSVPGCSSELLEEQEERGRSSDLFFSFLFSFLSRIVCYKTEYGGSVSDRDLVRSNSPAIRWGCGNRYRKKQKHQPPDLATDGQLRPYRQSLLYGTRPRVQPPKRLSISPPIPPQGLHERAALAL
jgi:hypothetical protein